MDSTAEQRVIPEISLSKKDWKLRQDIVFLNHGSYGACPNVLIEEQRYWIEKLEEQPVLYFRELNGRMRKAREALSSYLGAKPQNLVYVTNATFGVNIVAQALCKSVLQPGDEILATSDEYGACKRSWNQYAVQKGVKFVEAKIPLPAPSQADLVELIWSQVTSKTKLIFVSHITSPTALRLPVELLCERAREKGILTLIDGAHVPGHLDLNLEILGADFYTGNCHKWMCAAKGTAFLWASDKMKDTLIPLVVGWGNQIPTYGDGYFIDEHEMLGTKDYSPLISMPFLIKWMQENNWPLIQERNRILKMLAVDLLCEIDGLKPLLVEKYDPLTLMGAVQLPTDTNTDHMKSWLYDMKSIEVVVHRYAGIPILRLSVHAHVSKNDILLLVEGVKAYYQDLKKNQA